MHLHNISTKSRRKFKISNCMIGTWKLNICSLTDASFFKSVSPDSGHVHRSQNFLYVLDTFGLNRVMDAREGNCSTKFLEHKVWQINLNLLNVHYIICVLSVWTDAVFIQFLSQWESPCPFDLKKKRRYCSILDLAGAKTNQGFVSYCCPFATALISRFQVVRGTSLIFVPRLLPEAAQVD